MAINIMPMLPAEAFAKKQGKKTCRGCRQRKLTRSRVAKRKFELKKQNGAHDKSDSRQTRRRRKKTKADKNDKNDSTKQENKPQYGSH